VTEPALLEVEDLVVDLRRGGTVTRVVDGVSFSLERGRTLALVGESGCGKSLTALALLRLIDPPLAIGGGAIRLGGVDLARAAEPELRKVRGRRVAMVFQEPMTALNPVMTVGDQIAEGMIVHRLATPREARRRALERMKEVGISDPEARIDAYPHQLSGGMRQRVMIAMALACDPELLIADEPTTALDVTVQAQILDLLRGLIERRSMSMLLITHDLGVVAETADEVAVMYAGRIVERAGAIALFDAPSHPYTRALFRSRPQQAPRGERLRGIEGQVPSPGRWPAGCRFHPRCAEVMAVCSQSSPPRVASPRDARSFVECHARVAAATSGGAE
jgi:peptide/nickel transport system ATP-binding protein